MWLDGLASYRSFKDILVEGLGLEALIWLRGVWGLLVVVTSPVPGGQVRGVGLREGPCLCSWQVHLPCPKQHISTAAHPASS